MWTQAHFSTWQTAKLARAKRKFKLLKIHRTIFFRQKLKNEILKPEEERGDLKAYEETVRDAWDTFVESVKANPIANHIKAACLEAVGRSLPLAEVPPTL